MAQTTGVSLTEHEDPCSDGLVSESDAARNHYFFRITVAQSETEVKPHAWLMIPEGSGGGATVLEKLVSAHDAIRPVELR